MGWLRRDRRTVVPTAVRRFYVWRLDSRLEHGVFYVMARKRVETQGNLLSRFRLRIA